MPKTTIPSLPLPGALFAIAKPAGPTCMSMLEDLKVLFNQSRLFNDEDGIHTANTSKKKRRFRHRPGGVKIGQGGTLDPLADGVLIIGIGKGTKQLQTHLDGSKTYRTTGLLGAETDSYDALGKLVRTVPWKHVTREKVESVLERFRGQITQLPPIYSALKMDGKALYEYAREGKKLPRPIEPRSVTVYSLECIGWEDGAPLEGDGMGHHYKWPENVISGETKETMEKLRQLVVEAGTVESEASQTEAQALDLPEVSATEGRPPVFKLEMKVSSGTYVRSLVHDIGHALGSAAHVVALSRTQQGDYHCEEQGGDPGNCVAWSVFEQAIEENTNRGNEPEAGKAEGEWREWENAVLDKMTILE